MPFKNKRIPMLESLQDVGFFSHHPLTQKVIALTRVAAIKKVAVHSCDFDGCFGPDFFCLRKKVSINRCMIIILRLLQRCGKKIKTIPVIQFVLWLAQVVRIP